MKLQSDSNVMTDQGQRETELADRLSAVFRGLPGAGNRSGRVQMHAMSIASLHLRNQRDAASAKLTGAGPAADQQAADQIKKLRHSLKWLSDDLLNLSAAAHESIEDERGDLGTNQLHLSCLPMVLTAIAGDLDPALARAETRLRAGNSGGSNALSNRDGKVRHALEIGWRARYAYFDLTGRLATRNRSRHGSFHQYLIDIFEVLGLEVNSTLIMRMLFSGNSKPPPLEESASEESASEDSARPRPSRRFAP